MTDSLILTPSLDAIAERPELARQLPREVAFTLHIKAQIAAAVCALAAVGGNPSSESNPNLDQDVLLNVKEAARVLGRSNSWVQQHARSAPLKFCLVSSLGRGLLFSRRKINLLITRDVGQNPQTRTLGLRGGNSGRRPRLKGSAIPPSAQTPRSESREV